MTQAEIPPGKSNALQRTGSKVHPLGRLLMQLSLGGRFFLDRSSPPTPPRQQLQSRQQFNRCGFPNNGWGGDNTCLIPACYATVGNPREEGQPPKKTGRRTPTQKPRRSLSSFPPVDKMISLYSPSQGHWSLPVSLVSHPPSQPPRWFLPGRTLSGSLGMSPPGSRRNDPGSPRRPITFTLLNAADMLHPGRPILQAPPFPGK